VIVQEPSSCVVGGMGASVLAVAGADAVVVLAEIPAMLATRGAPRVIPVAAGQTARDADRGPVVL
jgi:chemotaxis response regulator CheB